MINLWAAKVLGLRVPRTLLALADEVIEYEPPQGVGEYFPYGGWNSAPTITVVSPAGDPRLPLVADAVAFWNETFAQIGTPFRLGALTHVVGAIPVEDLKKLSPSAITNSPMPESLKRIGGNIVVVLSEGKFSPLRLPACKR